MVAEQYDIFGNLVPIEEIVSKKPSKKFKTMQEMFGLIEGKTCKTCTYLEKREWQNTYYKCKKWHLSHSNATDIRLKNKACGMYESQ